MCRQHSNQAAKLQRHRINADTVCMGNTVTLLLILVLFSIGVWVSDGLTDWRITGVRSDFSMFWGTSYIVLHDGMPRAYDLNCMMAVIHQFGMLAPGSNRPLPQLHLPTFLLVALSLALLPSWPGHLVFMLAIGPFYAKATSGLPGNCVVSRHRVWVMVVGSLAVFVTVLMGQNFMLTAGSTAMAVT